MKVFLYSFKMFILQISKDGMLAAVCIAPILAACFFRFGIPYIEEILCGYFNKESILSEYYLLIDLQLSALTPFMLCFASSMVILTEYDENMISYLAVTPVGKMGYLISRLVIPAGISYFVSVILMIYFSLTAWSFPMLLVVCLLTCILSIAISLLLVSYSHNRVEGMALSKLSGLVLFGIAIPFFLSSGVQYVFSALPSFWIAKLCIEGNYLFFIPAILTSFIWITLLYKKFDTKIA